MDIVQKVKDIVVDKLGLSAEEVVPTARFQEDLNADSLDIVELVMGLEEEFEISIPDEDVAEVRCVQDAIDYVTRCLSEAGNGKEATAAASA